MFNNIKTIKLYTNQINQNYFLHKFIQIINPEYILPNILMKTYKSKIHVQQDNIE